MGLARIAAASTAVLLLGGVTVLPAAADHAGDNGWPNAPAEDARDAPPDDPRFDRGEESPPFSCGDPGGLNQQWEWFGYPSVCQSPTATYTQGPDAGSPQVAGASIDRAWQVSTGRPDVVVAIMDTGIDWGETDLDTKVWLNPGELPDATDRNGNGVIDVLDFCGDADARFACDAADALVPDANPPDPGRGRDEIGNGLLDGQDVLLAFSDGVDDDGNGYVDDIVGWDFFDDDNDPYDVSSHASARTHGTGRTEEAVAETNNGEGIASSCPDCRFMPMRIWDTFIPDTNNYAAAIVYAADNGAKVTEAAIGAFSDTTFAFDAHEYAWESGVLPVVVSSDLNTAHHDYPASETYALWINGHVPDTFGADGVPPNTWFRQANLTQYGAHAHVGIGGLTGSQATGKASGVVALLASHARDLDMELTANELKQLMTMTAEDVLPGNTLGVGTPDPSQPGWDQYFGYGRIHARDAIDAITDGAVPPEAFLTSPDWFRILRPGERVVVEGLVRADRSAAVTWELQGAAGIEPPDDAFEVLASGSGPVDGVLAALEPGVLADLFPEGFDFGAPPSDPDQFDVTLRLQVRDADDRLGEDRRMVYLHEDPDAVPGWPIEVGPSTVASPRVWDLDADGQLEVVLADADGRLRVHDPDGTVVWEHLSTPHPSIAPHADAPGIAALGVPRNPWLTPLIADLEDDLAHDVIAVDGSGVVHRLTADGELVWTRSIDRSRSLPADRRRNEAMATGVIGSPALGDVDGDGRLDIVLGDLAGDLYVWDADGELLPGFPLRLRHAELVDGGYEPPPDQDYDVKVIVSPVLADLDPDSPGDEIVLPTNEFLPNSASTQDAFEEAVQAGFLEVVAALRGVPSELLAEGLADVDNVIYALRSDGTLLDGWPVRIPTAAGSALPLIAPSIQNVAGDLDGDGELELFANGATGSILRLGADGSHEQRYPTTGPGPASDATDRSGYIPFLEWPALGDLDRDGGLEAFKGAISLNALLNLAVTPGQNVPQDHVILGWDGASGELLPAYPRAIVDWQILIHPAVADVGGGATNHVIVGNGLYTVDAFDPSGGSPDGWPQFTGGWMVTSPAVADLDGDGTVEVIATTREGYALAWTTDGAAAENDEWWSFHHDERSTGTYGTDTRPPNVVLDAVLRGGSGSQPSLLTFTAPGDDWGVGTAVAYEVRTSDQPITTFDEWQRATPVVDLPAPGEAGTAEAVDLPPDAGPFAAVVAVDDAGNRSALVAAGRAFPIELDPPPPVAPPTPGTGGGAALLAVVVLGLAGAAARVTRFALP